MGFYYTAWPTCIWRQKEAKQRKFRGWRGGRGHHVARDCRMEAKGGETEIEKDE